MSSGNGHGGAPVDFVEMHFPPLVEAPPQPHRRPVTLPLILFLLTVLSTLAVGAEFSRAYANNEEPFSSDANPFVTMILPFERPSLLVLGIPFSFTLMVILLAHELGHYFACKLYGIDVSYPYFIPAPTLFGTFGAFIRIRSPITTRRALFDVGLAGPVVGFMFAVPALALAVLHSKIVPGAQDNAAIIFGNPPLIHLFIALFHPHVRPENLLLHPVGRAAWVGLFATALNLLPAWQLDGGHIVYSLASKQHRRISLAVALALVPFGIFFWHGWIFWGVLLCALSLRFRHPPLLDPWERLDTTRRLWAVAALLIFVLSFTPWPTNNP
ncbi:MAG: site-2 protease family protein [Candidatus Acidiferrales bacterium]